MGGLVKYWYLILNLVILLEISRPEFLLLWYLVCIGIPEKELHARTHRSKLQLALLQEVDQSRVRLSSRFTSVSKTASGTLLLEFQDGFTDEVDLLVGADGVRSVSKLGLNTTPRTAF